VLDEDLDLHFGIRRAAEDGTEGVDDDDGGTGEGDFLGDLFQHAFQAAIY